MILVVWLDKSGLDKLRWVIVGWLRSVLLVMVMEWIGWFVWLGELGWLWGSDLNALLRMKIQ